MSRLRFRDENNLTEAEMLMLLEEDDTEYDALIEEDAASDIEDNDHVSDQEEVDDLICANDEETEPLQVDQSDSCGDSDPFYIAKDGTHWSKLPVNKISRRSRANILTVAPGSNSKTSSIKDAFFLFFTPDILEILVRETNRKARQYFDEWNAANPTRTKKYAATNDTEIEAYIGLLITMGALQASREPIEMLFTSDLAYCRPIFPATLSRNRYNFLTKFLRFDNFETRQERRLIDKLAPVRDIFEKLVSNCKRALNPSHHLCVDEQLVPFRGKAPFRVYMKNKPAKYGIKIWALADCGSNYTVNMQVYLGKINNKPEKNQGQRVVLDLVEHLGTGYGITTDNFFTSLKLADKLWEKKLTLCGTLRKNKTFIPRELLPSPMKPVLSSMFAFKKNRTLVSYVPQKRRAVLLLSSEHEDDKVNGEDVDNKPDIILHYNSTKGAVDATDQMAQKYTTQRKTARWPMAIFYHMIDIAAINAFKIWVMANPEYEKGHLDARRRFLLQLGKDLSKDHIMFRYKNNNGLKANIKECMLKVFPEMKEERTPQEQPEATQGRCYLCTRQFCIDCCQFVCLEHSQKQVLCLTCKNKK
ncbi:piggyBac transposable element-derived protein 4-like [Photinus pyralis]|uniref:piggyBac transposable element-derived protein 4-like n=1 Tax=Photinus pyralis TaxID=7054 RepID=UPI001267063D|nr:piggyBac transposable element-derived protein 4-like [Photinus pyralis]XP_031335350.1 piggyBac transposable element-derived protein 4-like [Photinus pyralis]